MGPSLSKQREYSQLLFPLCYHIRTSLVGKFLIYAVIFFAGTGKALISRCCCTPWISLFCCSGSLPRRHQQSVQTEVRVSADHSLWMTIGKGCTGNTKKEAAPHASCCFLCVCSSSGTRPLFFLFRLFFPSFFFLFEIPEEISKHSQSLLHVLSCVLCFLFFPQPCRCLCLPRVEAHCLANPDSLCLPSAL